MVTIRPAARGDEASIHALIVELAVFERAPDQVINTVAQLGADLFEHQVCAALVAVGDDENIVGFALYYRSYSTWTGQALYLEDFYVQPACRRLGVGRALFDAVVDVARTWGVRRMDWQVLEWNTGAIDFYRDYGAELDPEWVNGRLRFT